MIRNATKILNQNFKSCILIIYFNQKQSILLGLLEFSYLKKLAENTFKVESQNFLDPVLENLSLSIKLGFKNTELG